MRGLIKEIHQDLKSAELQKLKEIKSKNESSKYEIRTKVDVGYPQDAIIETAKDENIDLIIIGNVGLSRIKKIKTLGSVSRSVKKIHLLLTVKICGATFCCRLLNNQQLT